MNNGVKNNRCLRYACIKLIACHVILVLIMAAPSYSQNDKYIQGNFFIGFYSGYSEIYGYYDEKLLSAPVFGLNAIPYVSKLIMVEFDFTYSAYELTESGGSYLYSFALNAGPLFYYPVFDFFHIYTGVSLKGNYLYLNTENLGENGSAFKPGFTLKAGFFIPLPESFMARAGAEYTQIWISNKPLKNVNYFIGVQYNLNFFAKVEESKLKKADKQILNLEMIKKNYALGLKEYKDKDIKSAKIYFENVELIDDEYLDTKKYLNEIISIEKNYTEALMNIKNKTFFSALPVLMKLEKKMNSARLKLKEIRKILRTLIPQYEKEGIGAFENENYKKCIFLMNRIRLIEPKNKTAEIYFHRARKRRETIEKFQ